jgi:hypothetical protein
VGMKKPTKPDNKAAEAAEKKAAAEAARLEAENQQKVDASKRRRQGRSSLITNEGGELGVEDTLG